MKKIILNNLLFLSLSASANTQEISCRVDSFSPKDGSTNANLTQIDDRILILDFRQHYFKVEVDKVKKVIFFEIKEIDGIMRASGLSPMPSASVPFILKYINRTNTDMHTLKCFASKG